jgi:hypothetical protein
MLVNTWLRAPTSKFVRPASLDSRQPGKVTRIIQLVGNKVCDSSTKIKQGNFSTPSSFLLCSPTEPLIDSHLKTSVFISYYSSYSHQSSWILYATKSRHRLPFSSNSHLVLFLSLTVLHNNKFTKVVCNPSSNLQSVGQWTAHTAVELLFHTKRLKADQHKTNSVRGIALQYEFERTERSSCFTAVDRAGWMRGHTGPRASTLQCMDYFVHRDQLSAQKENMQREVH